MLLLIVDIILDIKIMVLSSYEGMERKIGNGTVQSHSCGKQQKEETQQ